MIPKIINQIWVGKYKIPSREKSFVEEMKNQHPDYDHILWTDDNFPEMPKRFEEMYKQWYSDKEYVYCADLLRWVVVYNMGGYYFDIDYKCLKNLNEFDTTNYDGVLFGHWGPDWNRCDYTIPNNIFGFTKGNELVQYIIHNMEIILKCPNPAYGPGWCGVKVKQFLGLENQFSSEMWEYHRIVREKLKEHNILYSHYNKFDVENFTHFSLYSWLKENREKFESGTMI
jgi:hypothetical protein